MSNVVSIEKAASRRGIVINYLSNLMVATPTELLQMDLPLNPGAAPVPTLVAVVERQNTGCRLLLSDKGGAPAADFHFIAEGGAVPADFNPRPLGQLPAYLARHEEQTSAVVMAGGVQHGDLTIARAVALMVNPQSPLPAAEALQQALEISHACETWQRRTADTARMIAAG